MAETLERKLARILDNQVRGRGGYGATRLARKLGVTPRTIDRWCAEETVPSLADVLRIVAAVGEDDASRALRLVADVFELVGLLPYRAPHVPADADPLAVDVCQLAAAAGELAGAVARADADGVRTAAEQAEIASLTEPVIRHAVEIRAEVHAIPTAERPLGLVFGGMP
jgi:transcriptional regulator with XRE-family HTH domain